MLNRMNHVKTQLDGIVSWGKDTEYLLHLSKVLEAL
jgi:hypothetical protein